MSREGFFPYKYIFSYIEIDFLYTYTGKEKNHVCDILVRNSLLENNWVEIFSLWSELTGIKTHSLNPQHATDLSGVHRAPVTAQENQGFTYRVAVLHQKGEWGTTNLPHTHPKPPPSATPQKFSKFPHMK